MTEATRLMAKLAEAEWLIRELYAHEGAEGFSKYLVDRLEVYEFETKVDVKADVAETTVLKTCEFCRMFSLGPQVRYISSTDIRYHGICSLKKIESLSRPVHKDSSCDQWAKKE